MGIRTDYRGIGTQERETEGQQKVRFSALSPLNGIQEVRGSNPLGSLVCALAEDNTYLLTVKHGSLDLPSLLADLEPTLLEETDLLHKTFLVKLKRQPARPASEL